MENIYIQRLIDSHLWIKDTFGEGFLKLGSFYSITKKFKDYFHDGIYVLDFDLVKGLYFYSVGLNKTEDKELGKSQWPLSMIIPLDSFWKDDENLMSDFGDYTNNTEIHFISKDQMFDNTRTYSRYFIIRALNDIKARGIEVPDDLYPMSSLKKYNSNKIMEFIRNNYFKTGDTTIDVDAFNAFKEAIK